MASAGNIGALLAVGDRPEGNEMAKVHAAKALETMLDQTSDRTGIGRAVTRPRSADSSILPPLVGGQTPAQMIEATPESEVTPVSPENDCDPELPIAFPIRLSGKVGT